MRRVLADSKWAVVEGFFDPLTAIQANRLAEATNGGRKVMAMVLIAHDTLLPVDARAALVAALRAVDAVIVSDHHEWRSAVPPDADLVILDDLEEEKKRSAEFVEYILERQGLTECPPSL